MELERIIGQHFILGFQGNEIDETHPIARDIRERGLGGVILFDRLLAKNLKTNNIVSTSQLKKLCLNLQQISDDTLLICIDQEGGLVCRLKEKHGFLPMGSAEELGEKNDVALSEECAQATGASLAKIGINLNFAPVADVNTNPDNPVIGKLKRSFSENPEIVAHHCERWLDGLHSSNVLGCLKHFPGHGSSTKDSHKEFVDISASWDKCELTPFTHNITRGKARAVMLGHLFHRELDEEHPATVSPLIINELLRKELNFQGLIITDDMQMLGITKKYGIFEATVRSLAAGADLIIIGNNLEYDENILEKMVTHVKKAIEKGLLTEEQLLASHKRIQHIKTTIMTSNKATL